MLPPPTSEPDPAGTVIHVGQDDAGRWRVQDSDGRLEGCFRSLAAAMHYARGERAQFGVSLRMATQPMTPLVRTRAPGTPARVPARAA